MVTIPILASTAILRNMDRQKKYARQVELRAQRRAAWIAEHGPCPCGSATNLVVDHIDPAAKDPKLTNRRNAHLWTWSDERRTVELAKCQVLCKRCHDAKTGREHAARRIVGSSHP